MAAGRNGGYHDNELKDRDSDIEVRKRKDFYYNNRDAERDRVRQRDIKERDVINGLSRSSHSSGSTGSDWSHRGTVGAAEREPGELSSGSGSDSDVVSQPMVKDIQNGAPSPPSKKRKFSPIVWDRDESDLSKSSKMKVGTSESPHPYPPLPPKLYKQSPNYVIDGVVQISPAKPMVATGSPRLSPLPLQGNTSNEEAGQMIDEDFVSARNISASRWADESHSPKDEGEISDDGDRRRRKISETLDSKRNARALSPDVEELDQEGLEGHQVRSSESGGRCSDDSFSSDHYSDNELRKSDLMEIDNESDANDPKNHQLDTESDGDDDAPESVVPPQRSIDMLQGCRSVDEFERLNKIDEGTYGVVYRAKDKKTGEVVALKKVKMEKEREGFPLTSLREINILLSFHHPSIVDVKEVVVGSNLDSIFMVMEYMEHDLKGLMESMKQPFSQSEVKCLMLQLLEGVKYLHDNWVLHRDLKTSNLLLNNRGELKICDFGLSRQYGSPLKPYTHLVVTLWYRAPELLLGAKQYSTAIDMWSLGCIMAELLAKQPLFSGKTEVDQLDKIFRTIGTPNEAIWPGFSKLPGVKVNFVKQPYNLLRKKFPATSFTGSPILSDAGFDLLNKLLTYDPQKRITAEAALNHTWFREVPLPKSKDFMPTFPAQHAQDRRLRRIMKSPDPLEEQRRKELQQKEFGTRGLFG